MSQLGKKEISRIIEIMYSKSDALEHGTDWMDRLDKESLKKKMKIIIECEEHVDCQIIAKLIIQSREAK